MEIREASFGPLMAGRRTVRDYLENISKNLMIQENMVRDPILWEGMAGELEDEASFNGNEQYKSATKIARGVAEILCTNKPGDARIDFGAKLGDIQRILINVADNQRQAA